MSGLSEMSFTSAAHKQPGHRRSGDYTVEKREVGKNLSSTLTFPDPEVEGRRAAGQKSPRVGSGGEMNECNCARKVK